MSSRRDRLPPAAADRRGRRAADAGAGRIAGISGIVGCCRPRRAAGWRLAFLLGLCASPGSINCTRRRPATIEAGPLRLVVAGLLVGLGTRYASGCTSGHGVCGLSRGSRRSLAATALFMGRASPSSVCATCWGPDMKIASALLAGLLFGLGLIVSGMADPAKVLGFLDLAGAWDPSLAFVMAGAVLAASLGCRLRRRGRALDGGPLHWPPPARVDVRLAVGSLVFGAGWGWPASVPGRRWSTPPACRRPDLRGGHGGRHGVILGPRILKHRQ